MPLMYEQTQTRKQHHWQFGVVIGLAFFAFLMSAIVSRTVFERLPHLEDEVAYLYQARIFANGEVTAPTPELRRSFWQPFVIDFDGRRFSKYTPGWSAVLALGVLGGQTWLINALFSSLTVALTFRLGREIFSPDVGLIASALVAFSPMALLLNASLMGHTAALCYATLFFYAYWRIQDGSSPLRWGIIAGLTLGLIVITRPLTAIAISLPFIIWSGSRLVYSLFRARHQFFPIFKPLIALSICTLILSSVIPLYNITTVGEPSVNLYTFVWSYDRVGFGECCGRNGHRLEKAYLHTRYDLSLTAADVFGWQIGAITPKDEEHLLLDSDAWEHFGLGFLLFPVGVLIGYWQSRKPRKNSSSKFSFSEFIPLILWTTGAIAWTFIPLGLDLETMRDPIFSWFWVLLGIGGLLLPLVFLTGYESKQRQWLWLLMCIPLGIVLVQLTYWIGSQRYSTRYYFEALSAFAIISAIPIAWLAQRFSRQIIYGLLTIAFVYSLYAYSTPRISVLYQFNRINQDLINRIEERRIGDQPLLVIITGTDEGDDRVRWRALGNPMVMTSPFLDSDIIGAWDFLDEGVRESIIAQFPDRQIIDMNAAGNDVWFADEPRPITDGA